MSDLQSIPRKFIIRISSVVLLLSSMLATASSVTAQTPVVVPDGSVEISDDALTTARIRPENGRVEELVDEHGKKAGHRFVVTKPSPARPFVAQLAVPCPNGGLQPGDKVLVLLKARFRGKANGEANAEARGELGVKIQLAESPYTAAGRPTRIEVTGAWAEFPLLVHVTEAIPEGRVSLAVFCGQQEGEVEIANAGVYRYPPETDVSDFPRVRRTYVGRDPDALWRKEALKRIEAIRKRDLSIRMTDAQGEPVAHAKVKLTLRRHEFGFGFATPAAIFSDDDEDARRTREILDRLCSSFVFENDLKDGFWSEKIPEKRKAQRRQQIDLAFEWLQSHHISVRGHYLFQNAVPSNLSAVTDPEEIRRHFLDTARQRLQFADSRVIEWDVVNHPVAWNGANLFSNKPGLEKLDREVFELAASLSTKPMFVNEDQIFRPGRQADETFEYIRGLKEAGFAVGGLGNQGHFHESFLPSPVELLAVTDRFAQLVPRQCITEFDIITVNDEQLAADYTRDVLIACFSHPAYTGFVYWGIGEKDHWKPEAAMWRKDWSIRKAGEVIEEWIGRRWRTEVSLVTDADGRVDWRGFPGWYDAVVTDREVEAVAVEARDGSPGSVVLE